MRGVITLAGVYKTGGLTANFNRQTKRFPIANSPRVVLQIDATATYYGVYDHTNKKILVYSSLGTEVSQDSTAINGLIFPFLAAGE